MSSLTVQLAAQNDQLSLLRSLISEDPELLNSIDADDRTALHWAASSGADEVARYLIDHKAEIDKGDASGWTPLHIAASAGQETIVKELVGAGADVNRRNNKGLTPL
ncbi:Psmd10 protein [Amylostereum chailletii]|nr:Psmd10 protein [Amylostereum chailletii]